MIPDTVRFQECPACGRAAEAATRLFPATLFGRPCDILKCGECGLVFKEWFRSAESVAELYPADYVHFAGAAMGAAEVNGARQKLARCRKLLAAPPTTKLRLLDVGCGAGGFVAIARQLGYDAEGIDPHLPAIAQNATLRRAAPENLEEGSFDVIVLLNVAEHIPRPRPFFASIRRLLKPDGVMLLNCPFGDSLARRFHRERWTHLTLDEHVLFWTPQSLMAMLRPLGFEGESSYRIAGSPFPFGRVSAHGAATAVRAATRLEGGNCVPRPGLQAAVWRIARNIQTHQTLANVVRFVVDITRTGDYLEFAVATRSVIHVRGR